MRMHGALLELEDELEAVKAGSRNTLEETSNEAGLRKRNYLQCCNRVGRRVDRQFFGSARWSRHRRQRHVLRRSPYSLVFE